ncbi:hypothetical protein [Mesorhizobium sp. Pch-S]|uniref:hypothetical protein n=1 Tax=Mesorhizobium sp. Pch-S TaxID=2082387 RepID=UPI0010134106|nr:hypothetical protein [Mesorhizobium sp. Pch-S]QAZ45910.1 hypothetical protein C1M53_26355 [Mesorhizobium sp. Pch-S]
MSKTLAEITSEGGPAFPVSIPGFGDNGWQGMTLRDWFAGQIIPAAITACQSDRHTKSTYKAHCAEQAYRMADALLRERAKGGDA